MELTMTETLIVASVNLGIAIFLGLHEVGKSIEKAARTVKKTDIVVPTIDVNIIGHAKRQEEIS